MPHAVVLGAGVIGLSTALHLQSQSPYSITLLARDFPLPSETIDAVSQINFTSPWGGAHNRLVPPTNPTEEREHAMSLRTFTHMKTLHSQNPGEAGITFMKGVEYLEAPGPAYKELNDEKAKSLGMEGFRLLRKEEYPDERVTWGCEYDTWCVNPMVFCSFLLRRFVYLGGKVVRREVRDPVEIFGMRDLGEVDVVVNCSGNGFGDEKVFITRGQTCLVANACPVTVTRQNADGSWTFCVPRNFQGGTIIGGTKEPNNWDPNPSPEVRAGLLKKFAATYPCILDSHGGGFQVIKDIVGRRPTRKGGMRLEREQLSNGKSIVHAYGLGGRGYELSWGVAEGVAELLPKPTTRTSKL
ncbi:FAD dependent oxidoreductase-like protein [Pseudomassariella vexata]|uniref:FAD dependent oxidoreductase-like protein n=1 Tax=Pseudomassariella vexata TaxID=1141098 RepID=A0A1Y2DD62_9PEZI|nr:FAD dependent oxidoreductase-like protein [Pseudomassariella vexata]ORY57222.1 FAD dependent oxidoreductase-like protein [Pseudomassariella vexata]